MDIILKRSNGYRSFQCEWKDKWVQAVLKYSQQLKRKDIKNILLISSEDEGNKVFFTYKILHS